MNNLPTKDLKTDFQLLLFCLTCVAIFLIACYK
jgi:hypothetical protein